MTLESQMYGLDPTIPSSFTIVGSVYVGPETSFYVFACHYHAMENVCFRCHVTVHFLDKDDFMRYNELR
jgi:hypothetical protein